MCILCFKGLDYVNDWSGVACAPLYVKILTRKCIVKKSDLSVMIIKIEHIFNIKANIGNYTQKYMCS